ncbi:hypothetical protein D3C86_1426270 [compost metagenome]
MPDAEGLRLVVRGAAKNLRIAEVCEIGLVPLQHDGTETGRGLEPRGHRRNTVDHGRRAGLERPARILHEDRLAVRATHGHDAVLNQVTPGHGAIDGLAALPEPGRQRHSHLLQRPRGRWIARELGDLDRRQVRVAQAGTLGSRHTQTAVTLPKVDAIVTSVIAAVPSTVNS